jgi:hypothetical protein
MHDTSLEKKAEALFRGTVALRDLADCEVVPILARMVRKTDHDQAVVGTYYRMHLWVLSLAKLDQPVHFQTVLNATRGLYELLVDLKLLVNDASLAEKYHDFSFVTRFSAAKKFIDHLDADPTYSSPAKPEIRRTFMSDPANQKKFDDLRKKHWGTDKKGKLITPDHWSGLDLAARSAKIGPIETRRYRDIYSQCSWFVHSGSAGIAGVSPEGLLVAFAWGHGQIQDMFAEGTEILCTTQHLFTAKPNLRQQFELAKVASGMFLPMT